MDGVHQQRDAPDDSSVHQDQPEADGEARQVERMQREMQHVEVGARDHALEELFVGADEQPATDAGGEIQRGVRRTAAARIARAARYDGRGDERRRVRRR